MAYDVKRLESALINADRAGDTEAAKMLAAEIRKIRGQQKEFSTRKMVSNIPSSGANVIKNYANIFLHPIDTIQNSAKLAAGVGDKAAQAWDKYVPKGMGIPGPVPIPGALVDAVVNSRKQAGFNNAPYADAVGQMANNRYGSWDKFKQTAMNDPVGTLSDISSVLMGGGSMVAGLPGKLGKVGATVRRIGVATDPLNVVKKAVVTAPLKAVMPKNLPRRLYQSAAKFGTASAGTPKERMQLIDTALKHEIPPTQKGYDLLQEKISNFNNKIDAMVSRADAEGKTIPKSIVFKNIKELRRDVGGVKLEGTSDLKAINRYAKAFDEHMKKLGKDRLTPSELQGFKQDAYDKVKFKPGRKLNAPIKEKTYKNMARSAKEGVEQMVPGIKDMNAELGSLYGLHDPIVRSANRIDNLNLIPLTAPLNIGAGSVVGGPGGGTAAALASLLEMPKPKSYAAIALSNLQRQKLIEMLLNNNLPRTVARQGMMNAGRLPTNTGQ